MKFYSLLGATALAMLGAQSASAVVLDNFDRANAGNLGSGWTQQVGTSFIDGNQAGGSNLSLATFNGATGNTISFDASLTGEGTGYLAAVFGYGSGSNFFIKVQQNGGNAGFNTIGFYTGNNNSAQFGSLGYSFATGSIVASYVGNVATVRITPTGDVTHVHSFNYGFTPGSSSIGLGFFGVGRADNFGNGLSAVPEPATWGMMILGFGVMGAAMRRRRQQVRVTYA